MQLSSKQLDMEKVRTIVYHLPDGQTYSIKVEGLEHFIEFKYGRVCDTSDIDGVIHFYPLGHA